ncbi:MerR family transcriptional regulator [Frateuria defendens]|uniref:MerR family transcriptional regulator n=1 Tax=Frateuria defendens TaxID=2219559 RepID=UPI00066FC21C|nr:MerR family transcriptional regulator [Frateuria defendens]
MLLTVGELARRTGLTVRTLHHYHAIGLLAPSLRSDAGYRLYDRASVERLHRIQALRQLGLSLADIGTALSGPEPPLAEVIERQIARIDRELAAQARLRDRLTHLRAQLLTGQPPDLADWLDTLELMTMYEQHFSPDELQALPLHHNPDAWAQWRALVTAVKAAMDRDAKPDDPDVQLLGLRWARMLERDTGRNADFLDRLNAMQDDPAVRAKTGITPALQGFVEQAIVEARLAIYRRYLEPDEFAFMRAHYGAQMHAWPPVIAALRKAMDEGMPPTGTEARRLAGQWMTLFRGYAGDDPATHARIREAHAREPDLLHGSWVDPPLLDYLRAILAQAPAQAARDPGAGA